MQTIGASVSVVEYGKVELSLDPRQGLTQQHGFLHAAVVAAILDSACGYAALTTMPPGSDVLSVEFKVNILAPAAGESFVARASVKRAGRRLTVTEADCFAVRGGEEKLVATMLGTMIRVEP
ncbi:MAG TPA: PaaI family thioesterase [Thermoanaerobaculia bacterium]|nr:PaaI family thioesterase [Thermoanaerobaculia bacterium]